MLLVGEMSVVPDEADMVGGGGQWTAAMAGAKSRCPKGGGGRYVVLPDGCLVPVDECCAV